MAEQTAAFFAAVEGAPGPADLCAVLADALNAGPAWRSVESAFDDAGFDRLALAIHHAQRASNPVLARFWGKDGVEPESWEEIPPVPAGAFKDMPIVAGEPEAVFRTSGTREGAGRRGEHHVLSLDLYRAAARANFRTHLLAGGGPLHALCLLPRPTIVPDSSLATMAGFIAEEGVVSGTRWGFDPHRGVDVESARAAAAGGVPVLILATAFALVQLLESIEPGSIRFPEGSRLMETGGFKGVVEVVPRPRLYERVEKHLGIPSPWIVNEYGMTELLSQSYDAVAGEGLPLERRLHRFPPWVRTRALDPASLEPVPPGTPGVLAHFDLANAGSVCHVLTEDMGVMDETGGFRLLGRASGAEARGCSLAAEAFLRATTRSDDP